MISFVHTRSTKEQPESAHIESDDAVAAIESVGQRVTHIHLKSGQTIQVAHPVDEVMEAIGWKEPKAAQNSAPAKITKS